MKKLLSYKTRFANQATVERKWWVIDAQDQVVGRLAAQVARLLQGKHKPDRTLHVNTGDCVIITNADKARFTGRKQKEKVYLSHTGYPGGQRETTPEKVKQKRPFFVLEHAIKGMLPKNKLRTPMFNNLYLYAGNEHPHEAQQPSPFLLK